MDVNSIPQRYESILSDNSLKSRYSLKFHDRKLEKNYRQMILSDVASALGINHRERTSAFLYTFSCVTILFNASYLSSYFENQSSLNCLLFQVLILLSSTLVTSILYYLLFLKSLLPSIKSSILLLSYFVFCEIIIFNIGLVKAKISENNSLDYGFSSILGILPLFYSSKFVVFTNFATYFCVHSLLCITYIITVFVAGCNAQRNIIEFLFLFLILSIESSSFYTQENAFREKYLTINAAFSVKASKIEDRSPKTDIEEISHAVKESIQMIPLISKQQAKNQAYVDKIFENLTKVMNLLGNRNSVYSVDMEGLDKGIDNEEKKFLEETCIAPRRATARCSTKYLVRKTIEVQNTFEVKELVGILKRIGKEWNFDVFFLKDCSLNKPLAAIGCYCMQRFHFDTSFLIRQSVCEFFFGTLESLYKPNPYHNSTHAADVLCSFLFLVEQSVFKEHLQDYELLAAVIGILGHDVGHPGVTNRFLINSKNPLAITCKCYLDNDASVLEMMHSATTFQIMQREDHDILASLSVEKALIIRALIIDLILATDMARHFDLIGKFKAKIINSSAIPLNVAEHRIELMKILTKASDVGHAAKSEELHQRWTLLISEEFFLQGDLEKEQGLPVSMYCDRETTDLAKSQAGFIKNIVLPIFDALNSCLESKEIKHNCLDELENNMSMWESSVMRKRVMTLKSEHDRVSVMATLAGRTGRGSLDSLAFSK